MKFVDVPDSQRINREPDNRIVILADGKIMQEDAMIKQIELLQYKIKNDEKLGQYSIITALIDTTQGTIEILYDEGYRGDDVLNESANMLIQNLGLSGLILRSLISLKNQLEKKLKSKNYHYKLSADDHKSKCALCDDDSSYYCNMNDLYYCEKHVVGHDENET